MFDALKPPYLMPEEKGIGFLLPLDRAENLLSDRHVPGSERELHGGAIRVPKHISDSADIQFQFSSSFASNFFAAHCLKKRSTVLLQDKSHQNTCY